MVEAEPGPHRRGAHRRGAHRRRRRGTKVVLIVMVVVIVGLVAGGVIWVVTRPVPPAKMAPGARAIATPGVAPTVTWPAEGQGAFAIPALGVAQSSPDEKPLPIGSVAKMMTALVVLRDHPLDAGASGPSVTVTASDEQGYAEDLESDQSGVPIDSGELLTERQLLEGLLIHSASDYAFILARFDAGSDWAFLEKMNATAKAMGLVSTTYTDPSGFDPGTVSTAAEQLVVASAAMEDPVFAQIVSMTSVSLPVAGTVDSYTPDNGSQGVVGVKSGLTTQAGGCDVMATISTTGGARLVVLSAAFGQLTAANRLAAAGDEALALNRAASSGIVAVRAVTAGVTVTGLGWPSSKTGLTSDSSISIPSWPGLRVMVTPVLDHAVSRSLAKGTRVAHVVVRSATLELRGVLATDRPLAQPSLFERLG
jgi:D-alanyl-D-alanine carboxypeptidase (penicillin-binding protein 5/6)